MKRFVFDCFLFLAVIFCLPASLFAADGTGVIGVMVLDWLAKMLKISPEISLAIFTGLLTVIGIVIRFVLKKIPGGEEGPIAKIIWSVLAFLFGDGVRLEGSTDSAMVKEALKKKYPLLNIEIKK